MTVALWIAVALFIVAWPERVMQCQVWADKHEKLGDLYYRDMERLRGVVREWRGYCEKLSICYSDLVIKSCEARDEIKVLREHIAMRDKMIVDLSNRRDAPLSSTRTYPIPAKKRSHKKDGA